MSRKNKRSSNRSNNRAEFAANARAIQTQATQTSKQETQAARPYPDSTASDAVDAYNEYIKKPHYNTSLELIREGKVNRLWKIRRGIKGYCALVERLETMGLLDANDCLNFSNVRTLNIMIRTRGLQKMFDNRILTPVASPLVDLETLAPSLTLVDRPKIERKTTGKKSAKTNKTSKSGKGKNTPKTKAPNIDNLSTADCQALLKALMVKMGITSLSL